MGRLGKRLLWSGAAGAVAVAAWTWWRRRVPPAPDGPRFGPAPFPYPPAPQPSADRNPGIENPEQAEGTARN